MASDDDAWLGRVPVTRLTGLQVVAADDANSNYPTALDIVWAFTSVAREVLPTSGPAWFASKDAVLAGHPDALVVVSLEVPPGSVQASVPLPAGCDRAIAVRAYPDYLAEAGQPVGDLTAFTCARIELGAASVGYSECSDSAS